MKQARRRCSGSEWNNNKTCYMRWATLTGQAKAVRTHRHTSRHRNITQPRFTTSNILNTQNKHENRAGTRDITWAGQHRDTYLWGHGAGSSNSWVLSNSRLQATHTHTHEFRTFKSSTNANTQRCTHTKPHTVTRKAHAKTAPGTKTTSCKSVRAGTPIHRILYLHI